jgi:hypothetical protein
MGVLFFFIIGVRIITRARLRRNSISRNIRKIGFASTSVTSLVTARPFCARFITRARPLRQCAGSHARCSNKQSLAVRGVSRTTNTRRDFRSAPCHFGSQTKGCA